MMSQSGDARARPGSLVVIFLTVFIDLLGFGIVLPLLPIYAEQFAEGYTNLLVGLLMASFSAMQFVCAPLWGRLSDRIGRRPVLMAGLAGSVVCYTLFGVATASRSLWLLFVSRIGAGMAGATIPTAQAYIADTTTLEGRARGMALIGAAFGLGFTLGPLVGYLAVPWGSGEPGPWPGYAAAMLSAAALLLAAVELPESLRPAEAACASHRTGLAGLRSALSIPSMGWLLAAVFVSVFAFANFEATISRLIKAEAGPFRFSFQQVCLTFAFIGLVLSLVQGGLVRPLSRRVPEGALASWGTVVEAGGFLLLGWGGEAGSRTALLGGLAAVVTGFAMITPSLNSLISRRSDPGEQGGVLGVAQSISSLARILGPVAGNVLYGRSRTLPLWTAGCLTVLLLLMVVAAARGGKDYVPATGEALRST
jgi:DHA1 family tetracycline resistance protein-like MFS transporter